MKNPWRRSKRPAKLMTSVFWMLAGFFVGTVFTFITQYTHATVLLNACAMVKTEFLSYSRSRHIGSPFELKCSNGETYYLANLRDVSERVDLIEAGDKVTVFLHPNNHDKTLEFRAEDFCVLDYDSASNIITKERNGFFALGVIMYFMAIYGLYHFIWRIVMTQRGWKYKK